MKITPMHCAIAFGLIVLLWVMFEGTVENRATKKENTTIAANDTVIARNNADIQEIARLNSELAICQQHSRESRKQDSIQYAKIIKIRNERKPHNPTPADNDLVAEISSLAEYFRTKK